MTVWTVPATVLRVVDGDTLELKLDLGWHIDYTTRCRLVGCNAPELSTEGGQAARKWVMDTLHGCGGAFDGSGTPVTFVSHQIDKYGRPLGQVLAATPQGGQVDLSVELIGAGFAVTY